MTCANWVPMMAFAGLLGASVAGPQCEAPARDDTYSSGTGICLQSVAGSGAKAPLCEYGCAFGGSDPQALGQFTGQLSAQTPVRSPMSVEKAFIYKVAVYGAEPSDIDNFGKALEPATYARAMANEFERARYRDGVQKRISAAVARIVNDGFSERFTYEGKGFFGEYSFEKQSFPLAKLNAFVQGADFLFDFNYLRDGKGFTLQAGPFANASDFDWAIHMSESDGSAFVRRRPNREVTIRLTYSIEPTPHTVNQTHFLDLYVRSLEVLDEGVLLGRIQRVASRLAPPEISVSAARAARSRSKVVGEYPYIAVAPLYGRRPTMGTVTLSDVGVELSGERSDGTANKLNVTFHQAFALLTSARGMDYSTREMRLWRVNPASASPGDGDYLVVWQPVWPFRGSTALAFTDAPTRDRFYDDLSRALLEWKARYAANPFADGKLLVEQRCEVNTNFVPCLLLAPSSEVSAARDRSRESASVAPAGLSVSPSPESVSGAYSSTRGDYLVLRPDGTFGLMARGVFARGSFSIEGQEIVIRATNDPRATRARISGDRLIYPNGEVWTRR